MKLLDPYDWDNTTLAASNVAETDPVFDIGATYALGAFVRDDATHTRYKSLIDANIGNALDDGESWIAQGPTNRWAMFDRKLGTITTNAERIEVDFVCPGRVTGIGLLRLEAANVQVIITDPVEGEVFNKVFSTVSQDNVNDFWDYFFAPILRRRDYLIEGLPLYAGAQIKVIIENPGSLVECGNLVAGNLINFGTTLIGATAGIIDYSRKESDEFGNMDLIERDYRIPANSRDIIDPLLSDEIERVLTERRAKPTLFVIEKQPFARLIYGIARDWEIVSEEGTDTLAMQLESLN